MFTKWNYNFQTMHRLGLNLLKRSNGTVLQFFSSESVSVKTEAVTPTVERTKARVPERNHCREMESAYKSIQSITMNPISILNSAKDENENDYIYSYIHTRLDDRFSELRKKITTLPINKDFIKLDRLVKNKTLHYTDEMIRETSENITHKIRTMNQVQLATLLTALRKRDEHEYKQIIRFMDVRLKWLLKKNDGLRVADLDLWLYVADLLYESKIKSTFIRELISYFADDRHNLVLSNKQLLHLLFLLILSRHNDVLLSKYEQRIFTLLENASIEDLAIISLAYFKTRTIIYNQKLLGGIVDQTVKNLAKVDPKQPGYCSIVKSVRYSRNPACRDNVLQLISSLSDDPKHRVVFGSSYNAVHTIKLMEAYRIYEPRMLHMLRSVLFRGLDDFRIKDIQYALTSLSNFAYMELKHDADLWRDFDKLVDNILSETRVDRLHQDFHLVPILRALAVFGYYNDKIISYTKFRMSDDNTVQQMKGVLEFEKSALIVHATCSIEGGNNCLHDILPVMKECSDTIDRVGNIGSVKPDQSLNYLDFILTGNKRLPNTTMYRSIAQALASSNELSGQQYRFNFQHTFSHQNYADLVITRDGPEPGSFNPETLLPRPVLDNKKPCVIYAIQKADFIDGKDRLCGYKQMMLRLFKKLGYAVLPVDLHNPDTDNLARRVKSILHNDC